MPENPGETSGGDSLTPPPAVAKTPAAEKIEEAAGGSTLSPPSVAATPASDSDGEAAAGSTLPLPTVHATPSTSEEGIGEAAAGYGGARPTVNTAPIIQGGQTSGSRTGALPDVAATPNPLAYPSHGTS